MRPAIKKKCLCVLLILACTVALMFGAVSAGTRARAAVAEPKTNVTIADNGSRGLLTNLLLSIGGENGQIWAQVKNQFTLFPSVISVYVELYSSDTYQESYTTMTLEKRGHIADLNMGETIRISVSTDGEQKYWMARMRYQFDDRDWVSKTTDALLYSADGVCLS